jgi:hypothetical protein
MPLRTCYAASPSPIGLSLNSPGIPMPVPRRPIGEDGAGKNLLTLGQYWGIRISCFLYRFYLLNVLNKHIYTITMINLSF